MSTKKEELLLRALTSANTDALQKEELSELLTLVTPTDVPLFARVGSMRGAALLHEWVESTLDGTVSGGKYAEGDLPSDTNTTFTRKNNHVMTMGRVAKISGLLEKLSIVQNTPNRVADAFANEIENKTKDLMRCIEYYLWNGDNATNSDEMDGVLQFIGNTVSGGSAALTEAKLREALTACYNNGGVPTAIYCRPAHAVQIQQFADGKVQYTVNTNQQANLVAGHTAFKYLSPFGAILDVIPVRSDFLPSGKVVILQEDLIKKVFLTDPEIEIMDIELGKDNMAKLLKTYMTLEVRDQNKHAIINNVAETAV